MVAGSSAGENNGTKILPRDGFLRIPSGIFASPQLFPDDEPEALRLRVQP
jgi:hypothetical protein